MLKRKEMKSMSESDILTHKIHRISLWTTSTGKSINIMYMDSNHIKNAIKKYEQILHDYPKARLMSVLRNELLYRELKDK